jgi:ABC-2 type transport system permease protein
MGNFIKKDILILVRDRKELAILILMPFILIAILGFALGNFINGTTTASLDMNFVLVIEDDEAQGKEQVLREIEASNLPEEVRAQLAHSAESIEPHAMLRAVIDSEEFQELGQYTEMTLDEGRSAIERGDAAAILLVPQDYTYSLLRKMLLDSGEGASLIIEGSSEYPISSGIFQDVMESFARNVSYENALQQISASRGVMLAAQEMPTSPVQGGIEFLSALEPIKGLQYYTFAMAVMFVMYAATSVASRAHHEKQFYTFDRIIIAGTNPLKYLSGKAISASITVFLQLSVLFGLSTLFFRTFAGKAADFWLSLIIVMAVLSICMGGLSALLTSLNFRSESYRTSDLFGGLFVTLLSLLGGSFFPTAMMSDAIAAIGNWTPNGAALHSFVLITQGGGLDRYLDGIIRLLVVSCLLFAMSFWLFPRRRVL